MRQGSFITFEGTEGAGKSTQIRILEHRLKDSGFDVCSVREPGGTQAGERIREILKDPDLKGQLTPEAELFLVSACRAELVRSVIRPALKAGKIVLCDRFFDSTLAYQGFGRGLDLAQLQAIIGYSVGETRPDLTLFIDIPLDVSLLRRSARAQAASGEPTTDRFELSGDGFFTRVENGFRELAAMAPERIRSIDGQGSQDEVAALIWDAVVKLRL